MSETAEKSQEETVSLRRLICTPILKSVHLDKRQITHLISNATLDRDGDILEATGWELENYKRNPVVLADHSYSIRSIIGTSVAQHKGPDGLFSTTQFDSEGIGAEAFRMATTEPPLLRAWSVGFKGLERHFMDAGRDAGCETCTEVMKAPGRKHPGLHFVRQELLEYSAVAVPANQDIITEAVKSGLVSESHTRYFFITDPPQKVPASPPPSPGGALEANAETDAGARVDQLFEHALGRKVRALRR